LLAVLVEATAGQTAVVTKQPSIGWNAHAGPTIAADSTSVAAGNQMRLITRPLQSDRPRQTVLL
jgi:hypothetical protein